ncbi:peptidoglycan-associated lipoprotein Pal [Sphingomonas parva]|uniref:Peptidoglycan-associated lipoprotein n=1 Tax=Sphingomonas parva TaxID=2555898 RepID=A0A4Y8ZRC6_9SPHN|nr:peptidoglycan-associated lipoprotein Pal [Sphingomonas parva]TFI58588.1 peptidoglycan-associated lipoprotein Pal [Sphingomonas parva]
MNARRMRILIATGVLAFSAACSNKQAEQLPPAPVGSDGAATAANGLQAEGILDAAERLRRDFIAQVGSDTVHFVTDSHLLDARARQILDAQAAWLLRQPTVRVTIEGHADERGTREYNLGLAERRANAAKNYLAARGIAASRMNVISWGKERPVALGSDEASWAQNRRAVSVVVQGY